MPLRLKRGRTAELPSDVRAPLLRRLPQTEQETAATVLRLQHLPHVLWTEIFDAFGAGEAKDEVIALRATCAAGITAFDHVAGAGRVGAVVASVRERDVASASGLDGGAPILAAGVAAVVRDMVAGAGCRDPVVGFAPLRPLVFRSAPRPASGMPARCLVRIRPGGTDDDACVDDAVLLHPGAVAAAAPANDAGPGWTCWVADDAAADTDGDFADQRTVMLKSLASSAIFRPHSLPHFRFAAPQSSICNISSGFLSGRQCPALLTVEVHHLPALTTIDHLTLYGAPVLSRLQVHGLPQLQNIGKFFASACPALSTVVLGGGLGTVNTLGAQFLASNPHLTQLDISGLTGVVHVGSNFVAGCYALREIQGVEMVFQSPHLEVVDTFCFSDCSSLGPEVSLRGATSLRHLGGDFARNCASLRVADLGRLAACVNVGTPMFQGCTSLLVLRYEKSHRLLRERLQRVVLRSPVTGF